MKALVTFVWVFIAQLGEHCSANAEATGSNPVEALAVIEKNNCLMQAQSDKLYSQK